MAIIFLFLHDILPFAIESSAMPAHNLTPKKEQAELACSFFAHTSNYLESESRSDGTNILSGIGTVMFGTGDEQDARSNR